MIVVSDTTPLISLLKINRIDLLEKLFGDVLIPQAVFDELTVDERFRLEADQIRQTKFIAVKPVNNPESASILKRATGYYCMISYREISRKRSERKQWIQKSI